MKKYSGQSFNYIQQQAIALSNQKSICALFTAKPQNKYELLEKASNIITTSNEKILDQSTLKMMFSRSSYAKENIVKTMDISKKIIIETPKEKTDFRFITETKTASNFAESSQSIKQVTMNSENVKTAQAVISSGNKYPDTKISLKSNDVFSLDIKAGNNAKDPFMGILAEAPYTENKKPFGILNTPMDLYKIQKMREMVFNRDKQTQEIAYFIEKTNLLPLDDIQKNIIIQEQLFHDITKYMLLKKPSFYHGCIIMENITLHAKFFEKLQVHIIPDIFANKKNAEIFLSKAFKIYIETVDDISRNIANSKDVWMGTGFENIADDIFQS